MSRTDDRADISLPVTAEVGSEGGSYADPTHQVATFTGDVEHSEARPRDAAGYAVHREDPAGADPDRGMVRFPTEPPSPPSASEGRGTPTRRWQTGLAGAAAGAALAIGIARFRNRQR